jgi:hypothetical protein
MGRQPTREEYIQALRDDRTLKSNTKLVLWTILARWPSMYPSQRRIAADAGLTLPTVNAHLTKALKAGWLVILRPGTMATKNKPAESAEYDLAMPKAAYKQLERSVKTDDTQSVKAAYTQELPSSKDDSPVRLKPSGSSKPEALFGKKIRNHKGKVLTVKGFCMTGTSPKNMQPTYEFEDHQGVADIEKTWQLIQAGTWQVVDSDSDHD